MSKKEKGVIDSVTKELGSNDIIANKVSVRRMALRSLHGSDGADDFGGTETLANGSEYRRVLDEVRENLCAADESRLMLFYRPITGGGMKRFFKRVLRKLLKVTFGWFFLPLMEQQTVFNGKLLNAVSRLTDYAEKLTEEQQKREQQCEAWRQRLNELEQQLVDFSEKAVVENEEKLQELADRMVALREELKPKESKEQAVLRENAYEMDYMDFENAFRGSRESIKEMQREYQAYFANKSGLVLDIGCGRGEFLELLRENQMDVLGIDNNADMAQYCKNRGLSVVEQDALLYLSTVEDASLAGVMLSQIVEHMENEYLLALLFIVYRKLQPGAYMIIETPNCESLEVFRTFYLDLSHRNPVPYHTLQHILEKMGFSKITRMENDFARNTGALCVDGVTDVATRENFENLNRIIFGHKDYTLIAQK